MSRIWSEEGKLARWLEVELAALDAWAELGTVPAGDAAAIRSRARGAIVSLGESTKAGTSCRSQSFRNGSLLSVSTATA